MGSQGELARSFKGIWIPSALYLSSELSISQKILLVEIDSLDNGERGCFAGNAYFSKFLQVSESQASRLVNSLIKFGLLKSLMHTEKGRNNERRLYLIEPISVSFPEQKINIDAHRSFKGIWIPAPVYLSQDLSPTLKVLLVEIESLDNGIRGCFASNAYFSKFLQVSESQASRLINTLVKSGFIYSDYYHESGKNSVRTLRLSMPLSKMFSTVKDIDSEAQIGVRKNAEGGICNNAEVVSAKVRKGSTQKCGTGIRNNAEHNKPVNKTINKPVNTNGEIRPKSIDYDELFNAFWSAYPNKKSGRKKPRELFEQKLRSGVTAAEIMKSIETHKLTRSWVQGYVPHATTWLNQHRWESEFSQSDFITQVNQNQNDQRAATQQRLADNAELDLLLEQNRFQSARPVNTSLVIEHKAH